jgi:hypothetical protein
MANEDNLIARSDLRSRLLRLGAALPDPARTEAADKILVELLRDPFTNQERGPIIKSPLEKEKYYVVPGEDMSFAETAIELTVGILGALANPVPLISTLCLLLFKFHRKAIPLNAPQGMVVLTLMRAPTEGWRPSDVANNLPPELHLSAEEIRRILEDLKNMTRRGEATPVVREFNGRWWTNEIW